MYVYAHTHEDMTFENQRINPYKSPSVMPYESQKQNGRHWTISVQIVLEKQKNGPNCKRIQILKDLP